MVIAVLLKFKTLLMLALFYIFIATQPVSAADYLEICRHFDVVLIRNIPLLSLSRRTEARRFIVLIDTLYDSKVNLLRITNPHLYLGSPC